MKAYLRLIGLAAGVALACAIPASTAAMQAAVPQSADSTSAKIELDFANPNVAPEHWKMTVLESGEATFDADADHSTALSRDQVRLGEIHNGFRLSPEFTQRAFAVARQRHLFTIACESHMKVAFQGTKTFRYAGPEGTGSCAFNYSKDKEMQLLAESFLQVENTILFGARLESLLQHDRLGLDREMEMLAGAAHDGNATEMGAIRDTLTKIAGDEMVLERARRKARLLLASVH